VKEIFNKSDEDVQVGIFRKNFLFVYERCYTYICTWTVQFEEFKPLKRLKLKRTPTTWDDVQISLPFFAQKGVDVNEDMLFNQFCNLKLFLTASFENEDFTRAPSHTKWVHYFKSLEFQDRSTHSELLKMCQYFFSIPAHNANVERVFSLINSQWTDERNRLKVETVKAIIVTQYNFKNISCQEFYESLLKEKAVLRQISPAEKYNI
jgi:hypothetical protein